MPDFHQGTLVVTQQPHFPTMHTRETVQALAAFGLDENQVAVILKCTPNDVRRYYVVEMEHGLTMVNSRVMSAVLHEALYARDMTAAKLWLVNKAGWRAGDGNKVSVAVGDATDSSDGTLTVVQRREVISKLLVKVTQHKRQQERVIDAEVVPAGKKNGANGHGPNTPRVDSQHGANGHGTNGSGATNGNGAKHK